MVWLLQEQRWRPGTNYTVAYWWQCVIRAIYLNIPCMLMTACLQERQGLQGLCGALVVDTSTSLQSTCRDWQVGFCRRTDRHVRGVSQNDTLHCYYACDLEPVSWDYDREGRDVDMELYTLERRPVTITTSLSIRQQRLAVTFMILTRWRQGQDDNDTSHRASARHQWTSFNYNKTFKFYG